jgi:archaellum component FlaC
MSDALLGSVISGVVALTVALLTNWSARKKSAIDQAKRDQKLDDQIAEMNKKLDEHNRFSDKIGNIEKAIVRIDTKMESLHK